MLDSETVTEPTRAQAARAAREIQIITAAREIAEADGWPAVTVRRLADAIGFSQPVLYSHFPDGRDGIVRAVAMQGFEELAGILSAGRPGGTTRSRVDRVANRYLDFAAGHPATYEAMFTMPIGLHFGGPDAPQALRDSFAPLAAAVGPGGDAESRAELFWSALHGLAELGKNKRLRPSHHKARVRLLVDRFS